MTSPASLLAHGAAILALALGLWAWDAQGLAVFAGEAFSFCF